MCILHIALSINITFGMCQFSAKSHNKVHADKEKTVSQAFPLTKSTDFLHKLLFFTRWGKCQALVNFLLCANRV